MADTSDLFRLEGRRKLSLRFLAMHLLQMKIQTDTHDSIEDARAALALYDKYRVCLKFVFFAFCFCWNQVLSIFGWIFIFVILIFFARTGAGSERAA